MMHKHKTKEFQQLIKQKQLKHATAGTQTEVGVNTHH